MIDVFISGSEAPSLAMPCCGRAWWPRTVAVVLSDDVIDAEVPCLRQLLDIYDFFAAPVLALMEVPKDVISNYGVVDAEPVTHQGSSDRLYRIRNMVEKPKAEDAPSNLAIIGRYILTPEIFQSIESIEPAARRNRPTPLGTFCGRPVYGQFEGKRATPATS
jgi:UTP--glucose-1-phosphate uridylyltransferase